MTLTLTLTIVGCSDEVSQMETVPQNDVEFIDESSARKPEECTGYGLFSNQEYDCGWKRGYDDYVYHYNYVKDALGLGECYTAYVLESTENGVSFSAQSVSSGYFIPNYIPDYFADYLTYNTAHRFDNDFSAGKYDGYMALYGQEPLSAGSNCGSSTPW